MMDNSSVMPDLAYVNGHWSAIDDAVIPINDRGLLFGDSVYEVVRAYGGTPFRLTQHLARLERSARELALRLPRTRDEFVQLVHDALRRGEMTDAIVYLQITRGVAPRAHDIPEDIEPTVILTVRPAAILPEAVRERGVAVITVSDLRWSRCDIKSTNLLGNVLALQAARRAEAFESIQVRDGVVTEGVSTNVFAVFDGKVVTPAEGVYLLRGVTRQVIGELARERPGLREEPLPAGRLPEADEIFLTSTTKEVVPVVTVDGARVGDGTPGPITRDLDARFRALVARECGLAAPA